MPKSSSLPDRKRVSLRDIAEKAGVSLGSVSSVLNNHQVERRIPHATADKIRETARKLGYLPNINARRLRGSEGVKNSVLLALITSFEAPLPLVHHFISSLHREAEVQKISKADYSFSLMIEMFSAGHLCDMPGLLTGDHFNAAILLNTVPTDDQFLTRSHLPYPVVLVNRSIPGYAAVLETSNCGARPADVFAKIKRKKLAVLHGNPFTQIAQNRVDAFLRRSAELMGNPAEEIVASKLTEEAAYVAVKSYFAKGRLCDGLYAVSDALAVGAYRAIKEHGLRIPKDIAVIGVGDYDIAHFCDPPLSSVGASHQQLAETASTILIQQILSGKTPQERTLVPPLETLRASTGH